jgi:acetyl/propionyl-CoA carboxylase alpha subunit
VSRYYDPLLAKLIVWGSDREQAIRRMRSALVDLVIQGVESSRDFHVRVMDDKEFQDGAIDIQWLERRLPSLLAARAPAGTERVAIIAAALLAERERVAPKRAAAAHANGGGADEWTRLARLEALR